MGIFKRPKYEETETDKMIKRQLEEEQKERTVKEEKRTERKRRYAKGMSRCSQELVAVDSTILKDSSIHNGK